MDVGRAVTSDDGRVYAFLSEISPIDRQKDGAMNAAVLASDPARPKDFSRMKNSVVALLRAAF